MDPLRLATRGSRLAKRQSKLAAEAIERATGRASELVVIRTRGDRTPGPLSRIGGKGLFTLELEAALREGRADLAVHSAKDMPAEMPDELTLAAVLPRGDARDALVSPGGGGPAMLPDRAVVGTGSPRRAAQLRLLRSGLEVRAIRGNVETRMHKALNGEGEPPLLACVLAMAGLERSGLAEHHAEHIHPLGLEAMTPAAGQGCLALQVRADREELIEQLAGVDDRPSRAALEAERHVVRTLGATCHSCLAVHVTPSEEEGWHARGLVGRPDGTDLLVARAAGKTARDAARALLGEWGDGAVERVGAR